MDIQTRKIEFVKRFLEVDDEKIISRLERLIKKEHKTKEAVVPMTLSELERRVDASLEDAENGRLAEADNLLDEIKKWQ